MLGRLEAQWLSGLYPVYRVSYIDGLMQERRNSSASAMELGLSCINPSICGDDKNIEKVMECIYYIFPQWEQNICLASLIESMAY